MFGLSLLDSVSSEPSVVVVVGLPFDSVSRSVVCFSDLLPNRPGSFRSDPGVNGVLTEVGFYSETPCVTPLFPSLPPSSVQVREWEGRSPDPLCRP